VAFTLRLTDEQQETLKVRAQIERTSMQDIAQRAIDEYVERHSRADLIRQYTQRTKADYAEALRRLAE
jgi:predicted transcriptional regulator